MSLPFIIACESGKRKIAEILLAKNEVDVAYTDEKGRTALHYAAHHGYLDLVKLLLEAGADLDYEDHEGGNTFLFRLLTETKTNRPFVAGKRSKNEYQRPEGK